MCSKLKKCCLFLILQTELSNQNEKFVSYLQWHLQHKKVMSCSATLVWWQETQQLLITNH